jgi:lipoic acid synthetase
VAEEACSGRAAPPKAARVLLRYRGPDGEIVENGVPRGPKPPWLKVRLPGSEGYMRMKALLAREQLNTICVSGRCPNAGECFTRGTATFMLMGDRCTRRCGYCDVPPGPPAPLDAREPERVARAVRELGLEYVVITSVTRDDLSDGGAAHFAATVRAIRAGGRTRRVEVLTPDFHRRPAALDVVLASAPDVFAHNIETARRLYPLARAGGDRDRALALLARARRATGGHLVKSGFMVGLGETDAEVWQVLADLAAAGCQVVTIGQYLRPGPEHLPVMRWVAPGQFDEWSRRATAELGFVAVVAGPLVRSSYLADQAVRTRS